MSDDILQARDVEFGYAESDWRLRGISFDLRAGQMLAIIGPNGSGKSTLLKLAAGVLTPQAGQVRLGGADLARMDRRAVARTLGYLPQQVSYAFDYAVEEVVAMGRFPHLTGLGFLTAHDLRVVEECLRQTETTGCRGRALSHLSGGERQRVFLASVLAQAPKVLLLDEPTTALDIHHQAQFFRLLLRLAASGIGVAVVTHDLNLASFYCGRLLLLSEGRAVREGTPAEVIREEALSDAYGESVRVMSDPVTGKPVVYPVMARAADSLSGGERP